MICEVQRKHERFDRQARVIHTGPEHYVNTEYVHTNDKHTLGVIFRKSVAELLRAAASAPPPGSPPLSTELVKRWQGVWSSNLTGVDADPRIVSKTWLTLDAARFVQ